LAVFILIDLITCYSIVLKNELMFGSVLNMIIDILVTLTLISGFADVLGLKYPTVLLVNYMLTAHHILAVVDDVLTVNNVLTVDDVLFIGEYI